MKIKISKKEMEKLLNKNVGGHQIMLRRLRYPSWRELVKYVIATFIKRDFVVTGDVRRKFGVKTQWATAQLGDLVRYGLVIKDNIVGSNMCEYRPVKDKITGEPIIYKYWKIIKEKEKV